MSPPQLHITGTIATLGKTAIMIRASLNSFVRMAWGLSNSSQNCRAIVPDVIGNCAAGEKEFINFFSPRSARADVTYRQSVLNAVGKGS
jgi:hypothetical protein